MLADPQYTWVGFNSENFDRPVIAAALMGHEAKNLKLLAGYIIDDQMRSWETYKEYDIDFVEYDHIDLFDVAPGVKISLKTYAGRIGFPNMMDMPFAHDKDLTPAEMLLAEKYCDNDCDVTEALFMELGPELELRNQLSAEYEVDLRSKSDAQIAEAILRKRCNIGKGDKIVPMYVEYEAPKFIKTTHAGVNEIIDLLETHKFPIDRSTGSPYVPPFLEQPLRINEGYYQMGNGGLHSTHDVKMYIEASDTLILSDFDVASYYPKIMMSCGLIPRLGGNKGARFLDEYTKIFEQRMEAKRAGNKRLANSLKITLNGTFGKLGNIYCSFYSPDLMLAVTITGQLNLLCIVVDLEKIPGVRVRSANTDGVLVAYHPKHRDRVLKVFAQNSKRTGFEYEETRYSKYAAKDVNNYITIKSDDECAVITPTGTTFSKGKPGVKRKGLYGESGLKPEGSPTGKNPTMEVCTYLAIDYLMGRPMDVTQYSDIKDFVAIRNVKGGGIQYDKYVMVDDWVCVKDIGTKDNEWMRQKWLDTPLAEGEEQRKPVKRKSRPKPVQEGRGGKPFGRVARWYMTKEKIPAIHYVGSGNRVPKTEGAKLCLQLPKKLPRDIDFDWYVTEAKSILGACGVPGFVEATESETE